MFWLLLIIQENPGGLGQLGAEEGTVNLIENKVKE